MKWSVPSKTTTHPTAVRVSIAASLIVLSAALAVLAGCGGDDRSSREAFRDRLQSIDRQGSDLFGRLAERAQDVQPGQPLPADVVQPMRELVEFQRQTIRELEELEPPQGAEQAVEMLIRALDDRTATFEQALVAKRFTARQFDQVTRSGDLIDIAFEQLRNDGFLPAAEEHG